MHGRDGGLYRKQLTNYQKGASAESFANIVKNFTGIGSGVFGENFGNLQLADVSQSVVFKIFAGLDFLFVVQPDHIKLFSCCNSALQYHGFPIVDCLGRNVFDDAWGALFTR